MFREIIVIRGLDYFYNDHVISVDIDDSFVDAKVSGSEVYDVFVEIELGIVLEMTCNCPYAAQGHNCKHMAAVLAYVEEKGLFEVNSKLELYELARLSKELDYQELAHFLYHQMIESNELTISFIKYLKYINGNIFNVFQKIVGYELYNYLENRTAYNLEKIGAVLFNVNDELLFFEFYEDTFLLNNYVLETIIEKKDNDLDYNLMPLVFTNYSNYLEDVSGELKRELLIHLSNIFKVGLTSSQKKYFVDFVFKEYADDEYLNDKIIFMEN